MRPEQYNYRVLCEDKSHYHFVRGYLLGLNVGDRKITLHKELPEGAQAGKQFVVDSFPGALKDIKQRHPKTVLIVVCDVDMDDVEQLEQKFSCADGDPVFCILPRRNIETWFYFLADRNNAECADESKDRKQSLKNSTARQTPTKYGKSLAGCNNLSGSDQVPESLRRACAHIKAKSLHLK